MKKIETLEEIHQLEVGILDAFDEFCRKNGLKYSLGAGTMIGAVRHQGFIPWDDDIDIFMMREEYDRFIKKSKECDYFSGQYKVIYPEDGPYAIIKIIDARTYLNETSDSKYAIGVWIDICPIDYGYDDYEKSLDLVDRQLKILFKRGCCRASVGRNLLRTIVKKVFVLGMQILGKDFDYWCQKSREFPILPKAKYAGTIIWPICRKDIYPIDFFDSYIELPFEGKTYMSFARYDDILSWRYGDYMTPPPEEKRTAHFMKAYYL